MDVPGGARPSLASATDAVLLHGFSALSERVRGFVDRDAAQLEPLRSQLEGLRVDVNVLEGDLYTQGHSSACALAVAVTGTVKSLDDVHVRMNQMLKDMASMRAEIAKLRAKLLGAGRVKLLRSRPSRRPARR